MSHPSSEPCFDLQDLFDSTPRDRIPKILVAGDGTLLAFSRQGAQLRRSLDRGESWTDPVELEAGGANAVRDETTGDILIVRPKQGELLRSSDAGATFRREEIRITPNVSGHGTPDHCPADGACSETGITLQFGEHRGRLVVPVRIQPPHGSNEQEYWALNYNTSLYSDDHGRSWQVGEPVQSGTGEGVLAELSDGRLYYNSRCHMAVDAKRRIAWSHDGGHRWVDWQVCATLQEVGEPFYFKYGSRPSYGCNAGLVRLPSEVTDGRDVLVYSAPDNPGGTRVRMTVWVSFDGAATWTGKKLVYPGPSAYSSLGADAAGNIYLIFERGRSANVKCDIDHHKISLARFNLAWLLAP